MSNFKPYAVCTHEISHNGNGGEALVQSTEWYDNGAGELWSSTRIILNSYGNCATLTVVGITPGQLRAWANLVESTENLAKSKLAQEKLGK